MAESDRTSQADRGRTWLIIGAGLHPGGRQTWPDAATVGAATGWGLRGTTGRARGARARQAWEQYVRRANSAGVLPAGGPNSLRHVGQIFSAIRACLSWARAAFTQSVEQYLRRAKSAVEVL